MICFSKPNDHRLAVPGYRLAGIVAAAVLTAGSALAQRSTTSTETMVISAAASNIDDATNTGEFKDISITQGTRRLTAERARATGLGVKNSQWSFVGHVVITLDPNTWLLADQATLEYRDGKLAQIRATGSPAYFDQLRTEPQPRQHGQADVVTYDAKQDTVNFQGHVQLSDGGGMELSAPVVVYSIQDHTWHADSTSTARTVHIKVKP
jgi:lipopolysaccharide transport protein LptA